jgi:hypothetical protein
MRYRTKYSTFTQEELLRIDAASLSSEDMLHLCVELQMRLEHDRS